MGVASVLFRNLQSFLPSDSYVNMSTTVEPLIKDTLNKGHLCIKDTSQCTKFLPLKEDNLSIMIHPNVSVIQRFHCILCICIHVHV